MNSKGTVFYSANTLKKYACLRGVKTNDLKKMRAKELFYRAQRAGLNNTKATNYVKEHLGHKRKRNTKIYINSNTINMEEWEK